MILPQNYYLEMSGGMLLTSSNFSTNRTETKDKGYLMKRENILFPLWQAVNLYETFAGIGLFKELVSRNTFH